MQRKWRRAWLRGKDFMQRLTALPKGLTAKASLTTKLAKTLLPPAAAMAIMFTATTGSYAMPSSGQVTTGAGVISQSNNTMTITQTTDKLGINWQKFGINAGERVNFIQPGAGSVALNRVIGNDPSNIYGQLTANGKVFLINPNGILFAPGATVNVGGMVASTLNLSDSDFQAGKYKFANIGAAGSVVNQGTITAANGGYIAMLAPEVRNDGFIVANRGTVVLGAGNALTLDMNGDGLLNLAVDQAAVKASVSNKQLIQADGGQVIMTAKAAQALSGTVVNNSGIIYARTIDSHNGVVRLEGGNITNTGTVAASGRIEVTSPDGVYYSDGGKLGAADIRINTAALTGNGVIDASGTSGGNIEINSKYLSYRGRISADGTRGDGGTVTLNSPYILLNYESAVTANGTGRGGRINLNGYADGGGFALLSGKVSANGGTNGGSVQVTAPQVTLLGATVSATGATGGGEVLVGGDWQGSGSLRAAKNVYVDTTTNISADAADSGNGGKIVAWSEDSTQFGGAATARGGIKSGDGGKIEISSKDKLSLWGRPDAGARAAAGKAGLLLLDPKNINISNGGGALTPFSPLTLYFPWGNGAADLDHPAMAVNDTYALFGAPHAVYNGTAYLVKLAAPNEWLDFSTTNAYQANLGLDDQARFGYSVALTNTDALIGAYGVNRAYLLSDLSTGMGITFIPLNPPSGISLGYGATVALTDRYALIGAVRNMTAGSGGSGAYLYDRSAGIPPHVAWTTLADPSDGSTAFGSAIALTNTHALIGDWKTKKAYLYNLDASKTTPAYTFTNTYWNSSFGNSVALNSNYALVGDRSATSAFLYDLNGSLAHTYAHGHSVALNNTYAMVGSGEYTRMGMRYIDEVTLYSLSNLAAPGTRVKTDLDSPVVAMSEKYALIGNPNAGAVYMAGGGDDSASNLSYSGSPSADSTVSAAKLAALLGTQNVTLQANNDITVSNAVTVTGTGHTLTLQAGRSINVNAGITTVGGNLTLIANDTAANGVVDAYRDSGNAVISTTGGVINAGTGDVTIELRDGAGKTNKGSGSITLGTINAKTITAVNRGSSADSNVVLGSGARLTATGAGDAIKLAVAQASSKFLNNSGSSTPFTAGNGRWLVYSQNPANDSRGEMAYNFKQYGLGYGADGNSSSILGTGNGFVYTATPTVTVGLSGTVTKTYDGDNTVTATLSNINYTVSGGVDGDTVTVTSTSGTYDNKNAGSGKNVTVDGLAINGVSNGSATVYGYQLSSTTASGNVGKITPKSLAATGITASNKVYDGTATANLNGTAGLSGVLGSDTVALSGTAAGAFADKNAGTGKTVTVSGLTLSGADAGNYSLNSYMTTADITPKSMVATGITASNKVYDGTTTAGLNGTAGLSGIIGSDAVTVSGTAAGAFSNKNAGIGKTVTVSGLSLSGVDAGNYSLDSYTTAADITPKSLTASLTGTVSKVYDGTTAATLSAGNYSLNGIVSGDTVTINNSAGTYDDKNVGTGKSVSVTGLAVSGADSGNYQLSSATANGNIGTITPKSITATGITASNKVYDGTTTASLNGTAGLSGLIGSDTVAISGTAAGAFGNKNAGTGKTVTVSGLNLSGADAGNYSLNSYTATADITPKSIAATGITASNKVYDGTTSASLNGTAGLSGVLGSDAVTVSGTAAGAFGNKNAGTGKTVTVSGLSLSGADAGNYSLNSYTTTADITPKSIAATGITASNKVYDGTTTASLNGTAGLSGLIGSDTVAISGTAAGAFGNKNAGTGKTVTVSGLSLSGADAGNYSLNSYTTTADITPKSIEATGITASNKVYDGTTTASLNGTAGLFGVIGSDAVTVSGTAAGAFGNKNSGTGKTVTVSGLSLSGVDAGNYSLNSYTTTADITPKSIAATGITATSKVYDGTTTAGLNGTAGLSGVIGSDSVTVSGTAAGAFGDKNAGTGKTITVSGLSLSGVDAGNYSLDSYTTTADITPKSLTASLTGTVSKVYDGTTAATLSAGNYSLNGTVSGDTVTINNPLSGTYDDKNAGTGKAVSVTGLGISGSDSGNYQISSTTVSGNIGTITPRSIAATGLTASNKVYDGTTTASLNGTAGLSGVLGSDTVAISGTAAGAFADKNAGTGKTVTVSGLNLSGVDAGNYSLDSYTTTANITPKSIAATGLTASNKVYDGTTTASLNGTAGLAGVLGSDTVALSGTAAGAFADKNAGTGKTVTVSGLNLSGMDAGNYRLDSYTTTADITPKSLDASLTGTVSKVYDGTTAATLSTGNYSLNGIVSGDTVTINNSSGTYNDKNVGTGKTVSVTGLAISGADSGNYQLASNAVSGAIGQITPADPYTAAVVSGINTPKDAVTPTVIKHEVNPPTPANTSATTPNLQLPGVEVVGSGVNTVLPSVVNMPGGTAGVAEGRSNILQFSTGNSAANITVAGNNNMLTISMPGLVQSAATPVQQNVTVLTTGTAGSVVAGVYDVSIGRDMVSISNTAAAVTVVPADPAGNAGAVTGSFSMSAANGKTGEFTISYADGALSIKPANEMAASMLNNDGQKLITGLGLVAVQDKLGIPANNVQAVYLQ